MKHLQKTSKRLPLVIRNKFLKKYKQILNLLASLLIIYFILSISGCIDITGSGSSGNCGINASKSIHFYPINEHDPPSSMWLEGNVRNYSYMLRVNDVCTYIDANGSMFVLVDTSAVNEGLTVSGKVKGNYPYETNFNTSLIHNFNNTGQSQFSGNISLESYGQFGMGMSDIYAIIKFPTKGSEQQDLNYLYSKVIDVYIKILYYKYNPDYKP